MQRVLEVNVDDLNFGGVFMLIKNVIEHKDESFQLDIATIEGINIPSNKEFLEENGSDIFNIGSSKNKLLKQVEVYHKLNKLLKSKCYDVVHIHADTANKLLVSAMAAKNNDVSTIIVHSHASGVEGKYRRIKRLLHMLSRPMLKRYSNIFVACSDNAAKWMYGDASKCIIIENGVDLKKFRFNSRIREIEREKLNLSHTLVLGHVGRFVYPKNHRFLIELMKEISLISSEIKLLLVGDGELKEEIRHLVREYCLDDKIIFYGTTNEVERILQVMDILLLPSFYEGYPIVAVEAQACGLPVIMSDTLSKSIKVTPNVEFLSIGKKNINQWVKMIMHLSNTERKDTYQIMKQRNCDISDTIETLKKIYQ